MTKPGHLGTGWAIGLANATWLTTINLPEPIYLWPILGFLFVIPGSTAPDWMEIVKWSPEGGRSSLLKHRTWTHYPWFWLAPLIWSFLNFDLGWPILLWSFCLGGITHLIVDFPNPMGIPLKWPTKKRTSLNLWKSGQAEPIIVGSFFAGSGAYAIHIFKILEIPWIQSFLQMIK